MISSSFSYLVQVLDIVGNIKSWETSSNSKQGNREIAAASFRIKQKGKSILRLHPDWSPKDEKHSFGAQLGDDWPHR